LDDTAQSILMNVARGDIEKLARLGPHEMRQPGLVPRIQPLRMIPEKEVYLYALLRGIDFHDATCPYAEHAQRGRFREILYRLEEQSPGTRHAIVSGYDQIRSLLQTKYPPAALNPCARCGEPTVHAVCKACELRERIARIAADAGGNMRWRQSRGHSTHSYRPYPYAYPYYYRIAQPRPGAASAAALSWASA